MSLHGVWSEVLGFHPERPVVVENTAGRLSSDGGLLVVREFDERVGLTARFAAALEDRRTDPEHSLLAMVRQRVYGLLAGYEDQNDHDTLRHDPVFQLVCGRLPADGQQTASRRPASRRSRGSRTPSTRRRCCGCGTCSSSSSSTRSRRRPRG